MVAAPGATPVTMPVDGSIVAMEEAELLHVPPPIVSYNVVVAPTYTLVAPEIVPVIVVPPTVIVLVPVTVPQLPETE
jgi:hypothetical protein